MIHISNVYFSYNDTCNCILNDINLNIPKGAYCSIVGSNGSCKSTLVKLILNLLKPCKGTISLNTSKIGYVPQKSDNFNSSFPITVYEMLKCHCKVLNISSSKSIDKSLEMVGMIKFKNSLIGNLSGGQQQKIFIARALIGSPELLILDEPSTGIDTKSQKEIYSIIKSLNISNGLTVISVEHNFQAVLKNSSHVIEMDNGNVTFYTIEDYKRRKKCLHIHL